MPMSSTRVRPTLTNPYPLINPHPHTISIPMTLFLPLSCPQNLYLCTQSLYRSSPTRCRRYPKYPTCPLHPSIMATQNPCL